MLSSLLPLAGRAGAGALFVVLFALVGEVVGPKQLSGMFLAAPSVALASLVVTIMRDGPAEAADATIGMVAGAVAMIVYCVVVAGALADAHGALASSLVPWCVWVLVALALFLVIR